MQSSMKLMAEQEKKAREANAGRSQWDFKDLAEYDEDHNGWIDENDSIFSKLKVWTKDENGNVSVFRESCAHWVIASRWTNTGRRPIENRFAMGRRGKQKVA